MAFIFSTSHLPETRLRRPDHIEDEEEDDENMQQPPPRAGGVRAFSHLPEPRPQADRSGPLSTRPAIPVGRPRPHTEPEDDQDTGHPPAPDSDHHDEDDTAPQDHADDRPWYMPRITAKDLPPQDHPEAAHAPTLKPWENTSRSSGYDAAPPADRTSGFSLSQQDLRDGFHPPAPRSPVRQAPAQDSEPALPGGRLFEQRSAPEAFLRQQMGKGASGTSSQQRLQGSQQAIAAQQHVRGANPPAQGGAPAAQPQALAQAQRPAANPAQNSPAAPQPPTGGPAAKQAQTPQFQVNEADANTLFDLSDQDTGRLVQKGVAFGDHVRSIINRDLENSPTAVAVFKRARELSGKDIVIHLSTDGLTVPRVGLDGAIHVYVNPKTLNPGTLAHEIAHILQDWQRTMKMRSGKKFEKEDRALDRAAGKREMEAIAPVTVEARDPQEEDDERENEAMRIGNIVRAEVSAAKVKEQLEALRKSNEEEYNRLIQNPAEIAKMFWTEMYPPDQRIIRREGTIHQNNKYRMPESTIYGRDYFTHVVNTLGNGVTTEILKKQTPVRKEYQPGPNQKLR